MILDEATSSIDTHTEKIVQDGMDALMKDGTVFVIAHHLSTVRNSDTIVVLEHGRIIEHGSHDELMASKAAITNYIQEQVNWDNYQTIQRIGRSNSDIQVLLIFKSLKPVRI